MVGDEWPGAQVALQLLCQCGSQQIGHLLRTTPPGAVMDEAEVFDEEVEQEADEDEKDDDGPGAVDLDEAHQKKKTAVLQKQQTQALSGGNSMRTLGKAVVSVVAAPSAAITSPRGNGSVVEDLEEEFLGE